LPKGTNQGLFYRPSPQPSGNTIEALRQWCQREFDRIADVLAEGASQGLRLDILSGLPDKPKDGTVMFFAAGVTGSGSAEGSYEYANGSWHKL
jgi:hypothetical protein